MNGRRSPYVSKTALKKISETFFEQKKEVEDETVEEKTMTSPKKAEKQKKIVEKKKEVEDETALMEEVEDQSVTPPQKAKKRKKKVEKILSKKELFDAMLENTKKKTDFIEHIENVAIRHTRIPLTIFTQYFHKRFTKHVFFGINSRIAASGLHSDGFCF